MNLCKNCGIDGLRALNLKGMGDDTTGEEGYYNPDATS
jgi:hypothetical protein